MRGIEYRVLTSYVMSTPKNPERVIEISCRLYTTRDSRVDLIEGEWNVNGYGLSDTTKTAP